MENRRDDLYLQSQFTGDSSTNMMQCTLEKCGGEALFETAGWYSDFTVFNADYSPWFVRGGRYSNDLGAGIFSFSSNGDNGGDGNYFSFRLRIRILL